ncbi:hypothetical protein ACFTAO_43125 [Paenibacillus rhizoplanae]
MLLNMFLLPLVLIFLLGASLSGVVGVQGGRGDKACACSYCE